jgi:hypothetical protein
LEVVYAKRVFVIGQEKRFNRLPFMRSFYVALLQSGACSRQLIIHRPAAPREVEHAPAIMLELAAQLTIMARRSKRAEFGFSCFTALDTTLNWTSIRCSEVRARSVPAGHSLTIVRDHGDK